MNVEVVENNININTEPTTISLISEESTIIKKYTNKNDVQVVNQDQKIEVVLPKEVAGESWIKDVYVNGQSVIDENGIAQIQIPDTSEFIKNTVDNLVNYYKKSETYSKEEINELASTLQNVSIITVDILPSEGKTNVIYFVKKDGSENDIYDEWIYINGKWEHIGNTQIDLTDYATKQWVKEQNYMPIPDFQEYVKYFYYTKDEVDAKLENIPTGGTELVGGDNTVIEDNAINVYTNTGYEVSDKDIKLQALPITGTTGNNKMIYNDEAEISVIYDGSNNIRRSENGFNFDIITLPYACKSMMYNPNNKIIFGLCNGYFIYSNDNGKTWNAQQSTYANNVDYISRAQSHVSGFAVVNKSTKTIVSLGENFVQNSSIKSTITPEFITQFSQYQFIWCDRNGTFKYGAGSQEGAFASISGVTVNVLKNINGYPIVGLANNNKIYILKNYSGVTDNEWIQYTLPEVCTVNDIILNPYDQTYYILNDINTYYKTKDFINYDSVDKNSLRGIQGYFTLEGIQMTTQNHNELLLAPTRTTLRNKAQEWDRALNKNLWVGPGLGTDGTKIYAVGSGYIGVNASNIYLKQLDEYAFPENILESLYVSVAQVWTAFDPYSMDSWFWEFGFPMEGNYLANKIIFNQTGSFWNQSTWEEEYIVEQYDYGYVFADSSGSIFKYVKLGNLANFFN